MKKLIIVLALFIVLFISSSQTYEQQSLIPALEKYFPSMPFYSTLSTLELTYWGSVISIEERGYYLFLEFFIRKGAHVAIFGLIALAIASFLPKKLVWFALPITAFIAVLDELHQAVTGGRSPMAADVLLDTVGALLALSCLFLFRKIKARRKEQHSLL
ncbi:VanZ like family protein [Planococcus massiliensis]|uniref:VanZ like family protein n=1 Tax=Planococcus massiliensis TaxID=1499687 RepID=A0A098EI51_9BACL|nr:VanZ family protein [Planococcus massiliensis]CEG21979.1 VanZ like family protein [Planococcus massiliensis]